MVFETSPVRLPGSFSRIALRKTGYSKSRVLPPTPFPAEAESLPSSSSVRVLPLLFLTLPESLQPPLLQPRNPALCPLMTIFRLALHPFVLSVRVTHTYLCFLGPSIPVACVASASSIRHLPFTLPQPGCPQ